jgi:hypothetical protein
MENLEKVSAFYAALKLADVSLSPPMAEFIYRLRDLTDEKLEEATIKDVKKLIEEINKKYPQE